MTTKHLRKAGPASKDVAVPKHPPKDPRDVSGGTDQLSISLYNWMWKRLDEIGEAEGYKRNQLMREVVRSFIDEWDADHAQSKKTSTR